MKKRLLVYALLLLCVPFFEMFVLILPLYAGSDDQIPVQKIMGDDDFVKEREPLYPFLAEEMLAPSTGAHNNIEKGKIELGRGPGMGRTGSPPSRPRMWKDSPSPLDHQILTSARALKLLNIYAIQLKHAINRSDYEMCSKFCRLLYEARCKLEERIIPDVISAQVDIGIEAYMHADFVSYHIEYNVKPVVPADETSANVNQDFRPDRYLFYLRSGDMHIPTSFDRMRAIETKTPVLKPVPHEKYWPVKDIEP